MLARRAHPGISAPARSRRASASLAPLAIPPGGHLCLYYDDDPHDQLPALLPFITHGLKDGERVVYVADDFTIFQLHTALASGGIDVLAQMARGALLLLTREDWRQPGELDSGAKSAQVRAMIVSALAAGFQGVRFGIEMTWTLGPIVDYERLRHWEATINTIFTPDLPARMICQYSRRRLTPSALHTALLTHPQAIIDHVFCANPFYAAAAILAGETPPDPSPMSAAAVDAMIAQLAPVDA